MNADQIATLNGCARYITVNVLRPAEFPDCTNGGITSQVGHLYLPHPRGPYTLCDLTRIGATPHILDVLPPAFTGCPLRVKPSLTKSHSMAGGNFVYSSDSRYAELYGAPLSVHDRVES